MPILIATIVATFSVCYFIWRRNYKLPLQRLERLLNEEGWISNANSEMHLVANTFMYGDFRLFHSDKAAFDILFGRLTSRTSACHFLAFLFPATETLAYASNSPFILQQRGMAKHHGVLDQFSMLTWYSDDAAAECLRQHLPLPLKGVETSFLIEEGIGMILFTFKRLPPNMNIANLVALAHEIRNSLPGAPNNSFQG